MLINKNNDDQLDIFICEIKTIKDNGYEIEYMVALY